MRVRAAEVRRRVDLDIVGRVLARHPLATAEKLGSKTSNVRVSRLLFVAHQSGSRVQFGPSR